MRETGGYDAGKKIWSRKDVALFDAESFILVGRGPASLQDRDVLSARDEGKPH